MFKSVLYSTWDTTAKMGWSGNGKLNIYSIFVDRVSAWVDDSMNVDEMDAGF